MAKRFRFLLIDADVVIEAWRRGLWRHMVTLCEFTLTETVVEEALFYEDSNGARQEIDLSPDIDSGEVLVVRVPPAQTERLIGSIPEAWRPDLNPGEAASLAWLLGQPANPAWRICSADHIVFRLLGKMRMSETGISLEEILASVGRTQLRLAKHFTSSIGKASAGRDLPTDLRWSRK